VATSLDSWDGQTGGQTDGRTSAGACPEQGMWQSVVPFPSRSRPGTSAHPARLSVFRLPPSLPPPYAPLRNTTGGLRWGWLSFWGRDQGWGAGDERSVRKKSKGSLDETIPPLPRQ